MKKIFLICLAILLGIQGTAAAKNSGLPEGERINIALEITDSSRHSELDTAGNLEKFLVEKLGEKNLVNVIETKISEDELILDEEVTAEKKSSAANLGELLVFDAVELPVPSDTPENFDQTFYKNFGVNYVICCEVLALGLTKVEDKTISTIFGAAGAATALIGSGNKSRDKTLRRIGTGIGLGGFIQTQRTAVSTVVNMQFISVETGQILWQKNFMGNGIKHRKPSKGYDDAWEQAYIESVDKTATRISQQVNKYVDKVIIKGKSDKDFRSRNFSVGMLGGARF